jgi:GNAT superfamily N-acetyltransferase
VTAPAGFTVRPIAAADAAAVAELVNVFDRAYVEEADTVDAAEVASWWVRIDLQRDTRLFVAADGAVAASAALYERIDGALDLDGYVHPGWTGHGLGGSMIDWLEEETVRRGFNRARTGALTADEGAGRLLADRLQRGQAVLPDGDRSRLAPTGAGLAARLHSVRIPIG